jgi:endonuclease I
MHHVLLKIIIACLLLRPLAACGAVPDGYYAAAEGLSGTALCAALHDAIDSHTVVPYSSSSRIDVHDAIEILDEDPDNTNNVTLIYSRRSEPKAGWDDWNREHIWPQSLGIDYQEPAYSDLHALRACDAGVNSSRGNKYYDASDLDDSCYTLPAYAEAPLCSSDSDSWEPPDSVKGDLARSLFYMDIRYEGDPGEPDLVLTDQTELIGSATNRMGRLSRLIQWHLQDPVDDAERLRNDCIYELFQANRNPFVDHPEWVVDAFVPRVFIERNGAALRVRWVDSQLDLKLVSRALLNEPWSAVTLSPLSDSEGWYIDLPAGGADRFFRLQGAD